MYNIRDKKNLSIFQRPFSPAVTHRPTTTQTKPQAKVIEEAVSIRRLRLHHYGDDVDQRSSQAKDRWYWDSGIETQVLRPRYCDSGIETQVLRPRYWDPSIRIQALEVYEKSATLAIVVFWLILRQSFRFSKTEFLKRSITLYQATHAWVLNLPRPDRPDEASSVLNNVFSTVTEMLRNIQLGKDCIYQYDIQPLPPSPPPTAPVRPAPVVINTKRSMWMVHGTSSAPQCVRHATSLRLQVG
ncbi:hypothetical protein RRG08_048758 [Elysia crispata]|uniref:Uncharacterized protein n=1 Tax=Elysia crispata TaxID=231223 RepID=A0AAE0Z0U3_9GAST|nr:hypothetical protein RRG08_048758 [Elysia crispata]